MNQVKEHEALLPASRMADTILASKILPHLLRIFWKVHRVHFGCQFCFKYPSVGLFSRYQFIFLEVNISLTSVRIRQTHFYWLFFFLRSTGSPKTRKRSQAFSKWLLLCPNPRSWALQPIKVLQICRVHELQLSNFQMYCPKQIRIGQAVLVGPSSLYPRSTILRNAGESSELSLCVCFLVEIRGTSLNSVLKGSLLCFLAQNLPISFAIVASVCSCHSFTISHPPFPQVIRSLISMMYSQSWLFCFFAVLCKFASALRIFNNDTLVIHNRGTNLRASKVW